MKAIGKRIISWALAGIIALALIPFMSHTVRAEGETVIAFDECTELYADDDWGEYVYCFELKDDNTSVVFSDLEGGMKEYGLIMAIGGNTVIKETNAVDLSQGFNTTYEKVVWKLVDDQEFFDTEEPLSFLKDKDPLFGVYITDDEDNTYFIIFTKQSDETEKPAFVSDKGIISSFEEDGYHYEDSYGWMNFTVDVYTLEVPFGTTEISLTFPDDRLAYGYSDEGEYVCSCSPEEDGAYAQNGQVGDKTAIVRADEDGLFPSYIHVQTPYDDNWSSDTLFAIKIVLTHEFTVLVEGEEVSDYSCDKAGYTGYGNYSVGPVTVPLYTFAIPKGTSEVTIKLSTGGLIYNYDSEGNWLAPWYDSDVAYGGAGITESTVNVDENGDGAYDLIQVQKVYTASYAEGDLLYAITFNSEESPAPAPADSGIAYEYGDEYEILTEARAGSLTADNAKTYFESILKTVTEKGSATLNEDQPNENAKVVLALTAAGYDATNVAGYDLVEPLCDVEYAKGTYCTVAAYSLLAMSANPNYAEETKAAREELAAYLYDELGEDGSISYEFGGKTYISLDSTAMVLQALKPYYSEEDSKLQNAGETLSNGQKASGGFTADGSKDGIESTSTTTQVIITLTEFGINPDTDEGFVHVTASAITYLDSCKTEDGFAEIPGGKTNPLATQQGNMAIVAYQRLLDGKTPFFDMSDVDLSKKPIQASDDGTLYVETDEGIDKDYTLTWEEIEIPDVLSKGPDNVIKLYDIKVLDAEGNLVEIKDNPMTIRLKVIKDLPKHDTYKVVFVKDDKIVETMEGKAEGEYLVFTTSHLSEYGIAEESTPATGDLSNMTLFVLLAILSAMILAVAVATKTRKKDNR